MLSDVLFIMVGLTLLLLGAEGLVRGGSALALRLGVTTLVVGLTVIALGTGSPEIAVGVKASIEGDSGLALGNIVGSNVANVALVLGAAALLRPMKVRRELIRREMPVMVAVTLGVLALLADGRLGRLEGALLVAAAGGYVAYSFRSARREGARAADAGDDPPAALPARPLVVDVLLLGGGLAALLGGADLLVRGAGSAAVRFGVSHAVIGLTVIAVGTSLPELATSAVSALRGEADVAFGNVIGSNVLNLLVVLGVCALIRPFSVQGLRPFDLAVLAASALALLALMWRGSVLDRREGALLLAGYALYLFSLA